MIHWLWLVLDVFLTIAIGYVVIAMERDKKNYYLHLYEQERKDAWQRIRDIQNLYNEKLKQKKVKK